MVGHKKRSCELAPVPCRGFPKAIETEPVVFVSKKGRLAVVAALYDMLWHTRNADMKSPRQIAYHASSKTLL
jgi:hypothetical protein